MGDFNNFPLLYGPKVQYTSTLTTLAAVPAVETDFRHLALARKAENGGLASVQLDAVTRWDYSR